MRIRRRKKKRTNFEKDLSLTRTAGEAKEKTEDTTRAFPERIPVTDERVKTSVVLLRSLYTKGKGTARETGVSFNGLMNMALHQFLKSNPNIVFDVNGQSIAQMALSRPPRQPNGRAHRTSSESLFTRPRLSEEEPAISLTYAEAARIWGIQAKHPHDDYSKIAKRAGVTTELVLAAEAAQEDPSFQGWALSQRKKRKEV